MVYVCEGCGASTPVKEDLKHDAEAHKASKTKESVKRTCDKSGQDPHIVK